MLLDFTYEESILDKWYTFYNYYKDDILAIQTSNFNQEDYNGRSKLQYKIQQYYIGFDLVLSIWREMQWNEQPWSYYVDKYDLDTMSQRLACNNISLDYILDVFGIPQEEVKQIFSYSTTSYPTSTTTTYDMTEILNNIGTAICINNI